MPSVHQISKTTVKPSSVINNHEKHHLTPWGIMLLPFHYIQYGVLFSNTVVSNDQLINSLKTSLSVALTRYYPLAGRLRTEKKEDGVVIFVDLSELEGVEFVHAIASNVKAADVADDDVPSFVQNFFPLNGAVGYDGRFLPLFATQVTELVDGVFIGSSFNHTVGDGNSCMEFLKAWSQICKNEPHGHFRELKNGYWSNDHPINSPVKLPFPNPEEFIHRLPPPPLELTEKTFDLSSKSMSKLKQKANSKIGSSKGEISSFQALCSLMWRSITRSRRLSPQQKTSCRFAANTRSRLSPPLPDEFFGCSAVFVKTATMVDELLGHDLGHAAKLVHEKIKEGTKSVVIEMGLKKWMKSPMLGEPNGYDRDGITIASSPRFDLYGCDFGWGRAVAVRSGMASKYDGKIALYMGREGTGSVHLELNLIGQNMDALLLDDEFTSFVQL